MSPTMAHVWGVPGVRTVGCWGDFSKPVHALCSLRVALIPKRWSACRGDARQLCLHPNVVQYLADIGAVGDEGDDAHLPAAEGAQEREHLLDADINTVQIHSILR